MIVRIGPSSPSTVESASRASRSMSPRSRSASRAFVVEMVTSASATWRPGRWCRAQLSRPSTWSSSTSVNRQLIVAAWPATAASSRRMPTRSNSISTVSSSDTARMPMPEALHAGAQLERPHQVGVAPRPRLGLVAELLVGVGLQEPGVLVVGLGEDDVVQQLDHPAVVALVERRAGLGHHLVGAAHRLDVAGAAVLGRVGVEVGGVAVVPADVALVHGLGVVADGAVVAPGVALGGEALGRLELLGDLPRGVAVVHEPHALVVQPAVEVALLLEVAAGVGVAEPGPVVGREDRVGVVDEHLDRLLDVLAPVEGVADLRPAEGQRVVQGVRAVLGDAQRVDGRGT